MFRATIAILFLMFLTAALRAADAPPTVEFSARDTTGQAVKVPVAQKVSILLFAQAEQAQSRQMIEVVKGASVADVQVIVVVSGKDAEAGAKALAADAKLTWPMVADSTYAASGKLGVHVWPTTVVVAGDGKQIAHLAGLSKSLATDLDAYLAFAAGRIDQSALAQRLNGHSSILDSAQQMADRHLQVAMRLRDKDLLDQARVELEAGLKLQPKHTGLQLALAEILLASRDSDGAMKLLDQIDADAVPGWRIQLLRGQALIAASKWEAAETALLDATRLNPQPGEAYYELGRVYQQQQQWPKAAEAFRRAFESTPSGQKLKADTRPLPATRA